MKKVLITILFAATLFIMAPASAKADAALDAAQNMANLQNNMLNSQFNYFNAYQLPVLNTYNQTMSDQMAQALAAQYQANMMYQMAMQQQTVNNYQLGMNYSAAITNLNTQYLNMLNSHMYNFENNLNTTYFSNLGSVNAAYSAMLGQARFPQVP